MARAAIPVVLLFVAISYSYALIPGMPGGNPLASMMMAKAMGGGSSNMMKMMGMMSLMKPQNTVKGAAKGAVATNPMLNSMVKIGLCKKTENNMGPMCTPQLCKLKGRMTLGNPNAYHCVIGFGCCFKDHMSMMMANILN